MKNIRIVLIVLMFSAISCELLRKENPIGPNLRTLASYEQELSNVSTAFAIDLFHQIEKSGADNYFFSPYSIHQMLSMAMNGNEGEVAKEFLQSLRYNGMALDDANKATKELTEFLKNVDPNIKLSIANAIWFKKELQVKIPFKNTAREFYKAEVAPLDMANPQSVNIINRWIEQQTNDLIKDMLNEINPDAVMYLVNAIYFQGDWKFQFDPKNTKNEAFKTISGSNVEVEMMVSDDKLKLNSYFESGLYYVEIPYSTGQYSMGVVFNLSGDLSKVIDKISMENLLAWRNSTSETSTYLKIPKFKMHHKIKDLSENLKALGLEKPFTASPENFTLLFDTPTNDKFISRVLHDAVIVVDEKGTEAAAATIGEISVESFSMIELNRPFVFFIQEKHSGAILFMGKLGDPSKL